MPFLMVGSVLLALCGHTVGEYYSKMWALKHLYRDAALAILGYIGSSVAWIGVMYHYRDIFVAGVVWQLSCVVANAFIGLYLFKEKLTELQKVGTLLAISAILLMVMEKK